MKRKMIQKKTYTFVLLSVVMSLSFDVLVHAKDIDYEIVDSSEVPDILSMLASATQANFEKIKSWEGRITNKNMITIRGWKAADLIKKNSIVEPNNLPHEIQRIINKTIDFKIDVENNRFFKFSNYTELPCYFDPKNEVKYPLQWGSGESIIIDTSEHQVEISPLTETKDHLLLNKLAIKKRAGSIRITDPRNVFYIGDKTLWSSLSQLSDIQQISNIETYGILLKENSSVDSIIYCIEISMPGKNRPFSVLIFDSEAGFHPVSIENRYEDGSLLSKKTIEFTTLQGVFLPRKWEMSQYFPDGGLMRREICTIEEQQINTPIADSTFSELTYLKEGDQIRDEIQNKRYTIRGGKFAEDPT